MAEFPIYENDAAIAQQSSNRIHNTQRSNSNYAPNGSGSSAQNRYPNIGSQSAYRQQPETSDIHLTSINRNQPISHNNSRRERRRNHAISMYDDDNYALAGPNTRNYSEEEIDDSDSNRFFRCYKGNIKKRWILLIAFIISLICTLVVVIIHTSSKEKGISSRNFPSGKSYLSNYF